MTEPTIEVIEQGEIRSTGDLVRLNIIDWNRFRPWRDPWQAMERLSWPLINTSLYQIIHTPLLAYPERDDFPGWKHVGDHEEIGRLYWNLFYYHFSGELHFGDCPDFWGEGHNEDGSTFRFWGDIGRVSPIGFYEALPNLGTCCIWTSVVDTSTLIHICPMIDLIRLTDPEYVAELRRSSQKKPGKQRSERATSQASSLWDGLL